MIYFLPNDWPYRAEVFSTEQSGKKSAAQVTPCTAVGV